MRSRPSDRTLRRWLRTGRPRRVERRLATDEGLVARLEAMTELDRMHVDAIERIVTPPEEFAERTVTGLQGRIDNDGTAAVLADLLGLGFHVARVILDPSLDSSADERRADG